MVRKTRVILVAIFVVIFITISKLLFFSSTKNESISPIDNELLLQLEALSDQVEKSNSLIKTMEEMVVKLDKYGQPKEESPVKIAAEDVIMKREFTQQSYDMLPVDLPASMCKQTLEMPSASSQIQMYNMLETISFADIDGGVWKQGFAIDYSPSRWTASNPLKVFVIPHSHTDPGWIKTFEQYYQAQVRHILDNMLQKLTQHQQMTFIYAELSFFSRWWSDISEEQKSTVRRLIKEKRFELVTGGWVMPDEAAAHYTAMIDQFIEGHTWIKDNIGSDVIPRNGWSIDPFGHTSTVAYLLKISGLYNMLIQRVHYSVKKHFSENKFLEFNWRQAWDSEGKTDMLCHMMPFYSYDVPHTCGPDPKICCTFDFNRLPGSKHTCPWKENPQVITDSNVPQRAEILLDQYRKKSTLYRSNAVLIPLGDDFRYDSPEEWDRQFENYQKLFDYMNKQNSWNVKAQFGTLNDYFMAVRNEQAAPVNSSRLPSFPTLSGDFFAYADRADHYWSGYFTSRPFYKHWDRELESLLRSAEIIYSLAQAKMLASKSKEFPSAELFSKLTEGRRALGLFQHHDAIAGTAKAAVVVDYGQRLLSAWNAVNVVIQKSAEALMQEIYTSSVQDMFTTDLFKDSQDSPSVKKIHKLVSGKQKIFAVYNSQPHERTELVRVLVSSPLVRVTDPQSIPVPCQVMPVFKSLSISGEVFEVAFLATVPALGLKVYHLDTSAECEISSVEYINPRSSVDHSNIFKPSVNSEETVAIYNDQVKAVISSRTGMLTALYNKKAGTEHRTQMNFVKFGSETGRDHNSGAYLFIPNGKSVVLEENSPVVRVIKGALVHQVLTTRKNVEHTLRLVNTPGVESLGVEIVNVADITMEENFELGMLLSTDVKPEDRGFFSDMNGYTLHRRKYHEKLHLQGNVYPMTSLAYLQDSGLRVSVLSAQSAGVMSLDPGELQIMLDRRLSADDNRGMGEAMRDNKKAESRFFIIIEETNPDSQSSSQRLVGYPSLTVNVLYQNFINQPMVLPVQYSQPALSSYSPLSADWPCELTLLNLRAQKTESASGLLLIHHPASDCSVQSRGLRCRVGDGNLDLRKVFTGVSFQSVIRTSLTDLMPTTETGTSIQVDPMNINTYKIEFSV